MAEQTLLLIDPNQQNLNSMEVQLRKYGYEVATATAVDRALQLISISPPDLIVSELSLGSDSAIDLCQRLKSETATQATPFMMITDHESKRVECLTAGADDVLVRPVYMAELKDRAELLLQKRKRLGMEQGAGNRFFGRLEEMGLLDLLQVIEVSKRSGCLSIEHRGESGSLWFQEGVLHDAEMNHLKGREALNRLLTWEYGQYEFDFKAAARPNLIQSSLSDLRSVGLKHVDQWNKMCEQLPPLETIFRSDPAVIEDRAEPLSKLLKSLIERFDGRKTALEVINLSPEDDLDVLQSLTELYFEGLIYEVREVIQEDSSPEPVFLDPQGDVDEANEDAIFGIDEKDQGDDADADFDIPPVVDEDALPPPVAEVNEDEIPEEGQDLLAELYSAPTGSENLDFTPPPVPTDIPGDEEQADETYSTLFGLDGAFDYDEEEEDFFNGSLDENLDPFEGEPVEKQPMSGSAKVFSGLLIATLIAGISFAMQDRVQPIKLIDTAAAHANWHRLELNELPEVYKTSPISESWEIEVRTSDSLMSDIAQDVGIAPTVGVVSSKTKSKGRKLKKQDKRRVAKLLKEAQSLKNKGGDANWRKAAQVADKALALQPTNLYGLLLSASLHMELGQDRDALSRLQNLMQIDPNYGNTKVGGPLYENGVIYPLIGNALQSLGKKREALKFYEDYLRKFSNGKQAQEIRNVVQTLKRNTKR